MTTTLYGLSTCPYCRAEKKYLTQNAIEFEAIDVDLIEDADEKESVVSYVREKTGGTLFPVLEVDDEYIVGFDKKKLNARFGLE